MSSMFQTHIANVYLYSVTQINAKDRASQHPLHRAATTGNNAFLQLLLNPPEGRPKTRLNTADRAGKSLSFLTLVELLA